MGQAGSRELGSEIRPLIESLGFELVELRVQPRGGRVLVRLFLDPLSEEPGSGVTHADCARVSREVEDLVEARGLMDASYVLEVSSAGLDRPLTSLRQFRRNVGRLAEIRVAGDAGPAETVVGRLAAADEQGLDLDLEEGERRRVEWGAVGMARLVPDFRRDRSGRAKKNRA